MMNKARVNSVLDGEIFSTQQFSLLDEVMSFVQRLHLKIDLFLWQCSCIKAQKLQSSFLVTPF